MHNRRDDFFAEFEDDFARARKAARPSLSVRIAFAAWFAFCGLLGLGVVAVVVWAVISLVTWVTAQ